DVARVGKKIRRFAEKHGLGSVLAATERLHGHLHEVVTRGVQEGHFESHSTRPWLPTSLTGNYQHHSCGGGGSASHNHGHHPHQHHHHHQHQHHQRPPSALGTLKSSASSKKSELASRFPYPCPQLGTSSCHRHHQRSTKAQGRGGSWLGAGGGGVGLWTSAGRARA
ncbi:unnamed protein product, partial [Discosporangium mesarthrocarpum]